MRAWKFASEIKWPLIKNSDQANQVNCVSITDEENLVKTTKEDPDSVKIYHKVSDFIYTKEPADDEKEDEGEGEDESEDEDDFTVLIMGMNNKVKGLSITGGIGELTQNYPEEPLTMEGIAEIPDDCPRSYFFEDTEMTLYTTGPCENSNKVYSWKIQGNPQSSQFAYAEGLDTIGANHDEAAFAHQGGKFVLFSGKGIFSDGTSEFLQDKAWTQIKNYPIPMWGGCATFILGDNAKVYISGGYQDSTKTLITNKIYAYDFSNDDYELIGEI